MKSVLVPKDVGRNYKNADFIMLSACHFFGHGLLLTIKWGIQRGTFDGLAIGPPEVVSILHPAERSMWRVFDLGDTWQIDWRGALEAEWGPAPEGGTLVCQLIQQEFGKCGRR